MEPKAEWGIVLDRSINGTGVIKVYNIEAKSYAHRLKFIRAAVPEAIVALICKVDYVSSIAFEDGSSASDLIYIGPRAVGVEDVISTAIIEPIPETGVSSDAEDQFPNEEVVVPSAAISTLVDDPAIVPEVPAPALPSHPYDLRQRKKAYATRSVIKGYKKAQQLRPEAARAAIEEEGHARHLLR